MLFGPKSRLPLLILVIAGLCTLCSSADFKIRLPKGNKLTPVQQLNREGVKALEKHRQDKAKQLFYKAYLLDPDDPFTLNNLGYISELEGDADRALRYYELSSQSHSQAVIDEASRPALKGRPLAEAFESLQAPELQANKANVRAISLLGKGRITEAESILKQSLSENPRNPFTMNNLGYVMESEGDLQSALRYYSSAAAIHSSDQILVAPNPKWRGKAISDVAGENARAVNKQIAQGEDLEAQVARLNLRGVVALNHNDPQAARSFFEQAFKLDPTNAFSLNNMGYITEMSGDRESAETYYQDARSAANSNQKVTFASRREAEGRRMGDVAGSNQVDVDSAIEARREQRIRQGGPIELKRRDNSVVHEPETKQEPPLDVEQPTLPQPSLPDRTTAPQAPDVPQLNQSEPPPPQ